jgi:hypothetical protein
VEFDASHLGWSAWSDVRVWTFTVSLSLESSSVKKLIGNCSAQGDGNYGQNIGAGFLPDQIPIMITNNMYNKEIGAYPGPYGNDNVDMANFAAWGHYSQLVWRETTSVGCATTQCSQGLANTDSGTQPYFTVCNYYPAGMMATRASGIR